jgi:hypothetical protein
MTAPTTARPPTGLGKRGRAFHRTITAAYELSSGEVELLTEVCRTLDIVEDLATKSDSRSLAEVRAQRLALGRMLAQLAIPAEAIESPKTLRARKAAESRWAGHQKRGGVA